uniref:Uncharacterized protein n=1 Tax=Octopus bimaculoides TaxID=37653 RepID=A0A0L8FUZ3_OCTBM
MRTKCTSASIHYVLINMSVARISLNQLPNTFIIDFSTTRRTYNNNTILYKNTSNIR